MGHRGPLVVTTRSEFVDRIRELAPDVDLAPVDPQQITVAQWADAAVVIVDVAALPALCGRDLPVRRNAWVVTQTPPQSIVFVLALELRAERVIELPLGARWLTNALTAL